MYIDSNIFIFAAVDNGKLGSNARKFVKLVETGKMTAFVSPLVFDEVVWKVQGLTDRTTAKSIGKALMSLPLNWLDVTYYVTLRGLEFYNDGLDPRDSLHAGVMMEYGIDIIVSEDSDFDGVKGIERRKLDQVLPKGK